MKRTGRNRTGTVERRRTDQMIGAVVKFFADDISMKKNRMLLLHHENEEVKSHDADETHGETQGTLMLKGPNDAKEDDEKMSIAEELFH